MQDLKAQDKVVSALWEFAENLQLRPDQGVVATIADGHPDSGTRCSLEHINKALKIIMDAFGYAVIDISS